MKSSLKGILVFFYPRSVKQNNLWQSISYIVLGYSAVKLSVGLEVFEVLILEAVLDKV